MRKYWAVARNVILDHVAYRLNYWLEAAGAVILALVTLWLWRSVAMSHPQLGGYSLAELTTYLIGGGFIVSYLFLTAQGDTINDDIHTGNLSTVLVRPIQPLWGYWFIHSLTRIAVSSLPGVVGFGLVAAWYRQDLVGPAAATALFSSLLFMLLAVLLYFLLFTQFALFAFWSEQTWGERFFLRVLGELASGVLLPLSLLAHAIEVVTRFLPFRFFAYVPMQVYLGKITPASAVTELLILGGWIAVLVTTVTITYQRGLRVYAGEGM